MHHLTPEEERRLQETSVPPSDLNENDRERAIMAAKTRQEKIDRGEDPGDAPGDAAFKEILRKKELDHSINLKEMRLRAVKNWQQAEFAAKLQLAHRRGETKGVSPDIQYLSGLAPVSALAQMLSGSDEEKAKAQLFVESLSLLPGFHQDQFAWFDGTSMVEYWSFEPDSIFEDSCGTFTISNQGSTERWGLAPGASVQGEFLMETAHIGTWIVSQEDGVREGTIEIVPVDGSFTLTHRGESLSGTFSGFNWQAEGLSGTWSRQYASFNSLAQAVSNRAATLAAPILEWLQKVIDPKKGSAIPLKALRENAAA